MKKFIFILLLFFLFFVYSNVYAYDTYKFDDFVYFDPVSNTQCNSSNYWTIYNQNTTCYRFLVIDLEDDSNSSTLKIILDHDVGYDVYENYQTILNDTATKWVRYKGLIDIIDEETIYEIMKLKEKPTLEKIGVNGGYASPLAVNSFYVYDGKKVNYNGFWTKDLYELDNNYVYAMNEYGTNTIVLRNKKRGIRPVIEIEKSLLKSMDSIIDISNVISSSRVSKYEYPNQTYGGNFIYKQLQGFTFTKDKFVFYSTNDLNPDNGILISYTGNNYSTLNKIDYSSTGHGNDITYNKKKNKVLLVGPSEYREIYMYDGDTLEFEQKYDVNALNNAAYYAFAYDDVNDKYLGVTSRKVFMLDEKFNQLYSFDVDSIIYSSIIQGMEYHNGYLYITTASTSCPNPYHLYCFYPALSSITYVYDVKLNSNGTPRNSFGKLVKRFYVNEKFGELEGISFKNEDVYLGYASHMYDNKYTYKFYSFPYSEISFKFDSKIKYYDYGLSKTIVITSNEELKEISGWNLSKDKHTLSKMIVKNIDTNKINVCDLYNNCSNIFIDSQKFENNENIYLSSDGKQIYTVSVLYNVDDFIKHINYDGKIEIIDKNNNVKQKDDLIATGDLIKIYDNYNNTTTFSLFGIGKDFEEAACYKDLSGKYIWGKYEKDSSYIRIDEIGEEKNCNRNGNILIKIDDIKFIIDISIILLLAFGIYLIYYVYNMKRTTKCK